MTVTVEMLVETVLTAEEEKAVQLIPQCLEIAAKREKVPPAEVSVLLVDDKQIQELNREYRQVNRPTDVLSFPQWEEGQWSQQGGHGPVLLGDIVISVPRAREQSERFGHSLERELGFLVVHGFLHLLGYDHVTPEQEQKMFRRQEEILLQVGLKR